MFLTCHTFHVHETLFSRSINNQMKSWLPLQRSLLSTVTYASRQLDKWRWMDFANLNKLLTTWITMKICDNLVMASFCLAPPLCCRDTQSGENYHFNWFRLLKFYILLKKKIVLFYVLWCQLSAKQNVWSLPLEKKKKHCFTRVHLLLVCRATCDKKALARPIVSLVPGYRTAFLSCPEKGTVHVPFFLQAINFSWSTRVNGMW